MSKSRAPQPKAYQRRFDFSASSTSPAFARLMPKSTAADMPAPRVFYAPSVYDQIKFLVAYCEKEVGWLGLVDTIGNDYLITEIFVPEQTVSGAETDIEADAMAALAMEIMDANKDPSQLFYWGHSHVNMGVSPSGQDETQIDEYLVDCPRFIRGIYNKRGESKVDVFLREERAVWQCVENRIWTPGLAEGELAALKKLVDTNVTEQRWENAFARGSWTPTGTPGASKDHTDYAKLSDARAGYRAGNGAWLTNNKVADRHREALGFDDLLTGFDYL
jgi:hypothetical protein